MENSINKAKQQALKYLGYRPRSIQEIKDYLKKKDFDLVVIKEVITYLEHLGYLNDHVFCQLWIENRINLKPMGKKRISYELLNKGIDPVIIDNHLESVLNEEVEKNLADGLICKKKQLFANKEKTIRFLYNRGFASSVIWKVINEKFSDINSS